MTRRNSSGQRPATSQQRAKSHRECCLGRDLIEASASSGHPPIERHNEREQNARKRSEAERVVYAIADVSSRRLSGTFEGRRPANDLVRDLRKPTTALVAADSTTALDGAIMSAVPHLLNRWRGIGRAPSMAYLRAGAPAGIERQSRVAIAPPSGRLKPARRRAAALGRMFGENVDRVLFVPPLHMRVLTRLSLYRSAARIGVGGVHADALRCRVERTGASAGQHETTP